MSPQRLSQFLVAIPSWWREYECARLLYVPTYPIFANYSRFTLRTTRRNLLIRVAISKCYVRLLIAFLKSAFIGAPSELRKEFPVVSILFWKESYILLPFRVRESVDAVGFFKITFVCSFDASLAF